MTKVRNPVQSENVSLSTLIMVIVLIANIVLTKAGTINRRKRSDDDLGTMKIPVEKCREQCFLETMDNFKDFQSQQSIDACQDNPDCAMCYDYCRVLVVAVPSLSAAMCNDEIFCMKGCQVACIFHEIGNWGSSTYEVIDA